MDERKVFAIVAAALITLLTFVGLQCSRTAPERDGFKIIEKHETYMIVEKDGQKYMASDVGIYGHRWQYSPLPEKKTNQNKPE